MPRLSAEQRASIVALAKTGARPAAIKARLGGTIPLDRIYNVISRARSDGEDIPRYSTGRRIEGGCGRIQFVLGADQQAALDAEAARRGVSPSMFVRRLIETIIADRMFAAVLDDSEAEAA